MARLGYEPDPAARSMRTGRTQRVGFIVPDLTNSTNATVAQAAERRLAKSGYEFMVFSTDFDLGMERSILERARNKLVDGLLIALTSESAPYLASMLPRMNMPIVFIDRECGYPADAVLSDHRLAMKQVVTHLVGLGHRKICLLSAPQAIRPGRERVAAFREALEELELPPECGLVLDGDQSVDYGYRSTLRLMALPNSPTALIAGANQLMMGAYRALRELHLSIPEDVSFVGTDDPFIASILSPPATVIWRDMNEVGTLAAELILERLSDPTSSNHNVLHVASHLELRQSTARANPLVRPDAFA
jgi:LacI family transcriptional regulator